MAKTLPPLDKIDMNKADNESQLVEICDFFNCGAILCSDCAVNSVEDFEEYKKHLIKDY